MSSKRGDSLSNKRAVSVGNTQNKKQFLNITQASKINNNRSSSVNNRHRNIYQQPLPVRMPQESTPVKKPIAQLSSLSYPAAYYPH